MFSWLVMRMIIIIYGNWARLEVILDMLCWFGNLIYVKRAIFVCFYECMCVLIVIFGYGRWEY